MRRFAPVGVIVVLFVFLLPSLARAQAAIAGVAKDTSGAVLPGVTVEASSPALIEKTRSVVTDGAGLYKIENLRPGTYSVTFTLSGFNTSKRDGVELTGSFTATVNVEMKVGAVEETITVTGETPIVDVQSATKERVLDSKVIAEIPTGRVFASMAVLVPGISQTNSPDVGGALGANMTDLVAHGSQSSDFRFMVNGVSLSTNAGGRAGAVANITAYQEIAIDSGAVDATQALGGPRVNFIPRDGGNTTKGTGFFGYSSNWMQSDNFTQRLKDLKLSTPSSIRRVWDFNPGVGGPIVKDKLWYFVTVRNQGAYQNLGIFYNKNANKPNEWAYVPDTTRPEVNQQLWADGQGRFTYQATPRNKLSLTIDFQDINSNPPFGCDCARGAVSGGSLTLTSMEANSARRFPLQRSLQADWTSPLTSRVLLEAVAIQRVERFVTDDNPGGGRPLQLTDNTIISVTDSGGPLGGGLTYRAPATYGNTWMWNLYFRTAVSYITGSHSFKFGLDGQWGHNDAASTSHVPYSYTFNSPAPDANGNYTPTPQRINLRVSPTITHSSYGPQLGVYAQDKWTLGRLTTGIGVRFDHFGATVPANSFFPTPLAPTLNLSFPEEQGLKWNDLSPKLSAVYDLFGNGKTAIKGSINRYLSNQTNSTTGAQFTQVQTTANRTWNDGNKNFIPDCDLLNPLQNGFNGDTCGADNPTTFGQFVANSARRDPDLNSGWFHRSYNWEFSLGVQQQVLPRVSVDVSYFRRIYGNFTVTDNTNVSASDYTSYNVTVPTDSRLAQSGQLITGLSDLNFDKKGQAALNYTTFADTYGKQYSHWNGVDFSVSARMRNGVLLQGGTSTGRTTTDNCEIRKALPEIGTTTPLAYCHVQGTFLTQVKALGSYTIPKVDVLVSGTFQSIPSDALAANRSYSNSEIIGLGRNLSACNAPTGSCTQTVSINLVPPGSAFGERVNQIDFRVGKIIKIGRTRTTASLDLYNLTNADTVLGENSTYQPDGTWRVPSEIIQARLMKFSVQWEF